MSPQITKPPPSPPTKGKHKTVTPRRERAMSFKRHGKIDLPMRSQYDPEWKASLRDAGYPTTVVVIDFETYFDSEYSMRGDKLSTIEYIMDERFENLGVSTLVVQQPFDDHENRVQWWMGEDGVQRALDYLKQEFGTNLQHCTVVAQNATFDGGILSFRYGIRPPYFIDLLGLARHWNSRTKNDLGALCKRWGLPNKGDTLEFKGATFRKRYKKAKGKKKGPKRPKQVPRITDDLLMKLADYANNDAIREWELFCLLMPLLSCPSTELRVMQHTLNLFFDPWLRVDPAKGRELTAQMEEEISEVCNRAGVTRAAAGGDNSFEKLLYDALIEAGDDPQRYAKPTKQKGKDWMFAIAKDDPEREQLEKHENEHIRRLIEARNAVKSWPLHIKRVNRIVRQAQANGGYLPVPLKYHGAHTGRWSGGEKINLQNLGSRGHELVNAVRELLVAPEGYELVIADASQIEARVLAWVAGQQDLIEQFKRFDAGEGKDVYCYMADDIVGYEVRKPADDDWPDVADAMADARYKGKVAVLGGGYGMGKNKFADSYNLPLDEADTIISVYREKNDKIVQFWRNIENAFKYTFKYSKPCQLPCGVRFDQTEDCDVIMTLPNGRELKYHTVQVKPDYYGESIRVWNNQTKAWVHIWGGYLTENLVQAISRDILWEAIERLEKQGHHTALHVHDELIIVTPKGTGEGVLKLAMKALNTQPTWAPECPLASEGLVSERYGGH